MKLNKYTEYEMVPGDILWDNEDNGWLYTDCGTLANISTGKTCTLKSNYIGTENDKQVLLVSKGSEMILENVNNMSLQSGVSFSKVSHQR